MSMLRAAQSQALSPKRVTGNAAVLEQQLCQGAGSQTFECTPGAFEPEGAGDTARPDGGVAVQRQDDFPNMAGSACDGPLFLAPQALVALPHDANLDLAMLAQAGRQGSRRRQPLTGPRANWRAALPARRCGVARRDQQGRTGQTM